MRYSDLMLLESDVVGYLLDSQLQTVAEALEVSNVIEPVTERLSNKDIMKSIDKIGLDDGVMNGEYLVNAKSDIKYAKKKYDFSVLMKNLTACMVTIGTGTAIVGKISDGKLVTALGSAIAIVGILGRMNFNDKKIQKNAKNYASELYKFRDRINHLDTVLATTNLPPEIRDDPKKVAAFDHCRKMVVKLMQRVNRLIYEFEKDPNYKKETA